MPRSTKKQIAARNARRAAIEKKKELEKAKQRHASSVTSEESETDTESTQHGQPRRSETRAAEQAISREAARKVVILFERLLYIKFMLASHPRELHNFNINQDMLLHIMGRLYTQTEVDMIEQAMREQGINEIPRAIETISAWLAILEKLPPGDNEYASMREAEAQFAETYEINSTHTQDMPADLRARQQLSDFNENLAETQALALSWALLEEDEVSQLTPIPPNAVLEVRQTFELPVQRNVQQDFLDVSDDFADVPGDIGEEDLDVELPDEQDNVRDLPDEEQGNIETHNFLDYKTTVPLYLGGCTTRCLKCKALHFPGEASDNSTYPFKLCCEHGQVELPRLDVLPSDLRKCFYEEDPEADTFYKNIHKVNLQLSMATLESTTRLTPERMCGTVVTVGGTIMHYNNVPAELRALPQDHLPRAGQFFFYDYQYNEELTAIRAAKANCSPTLMGRLTEAISAVNPLMREFYRVGEILRLEREAADVQNRPENVVVLRELLPPAGVDDMTARRYDKQQAKFEVAVLTEGLDDIYNAPETTIIRVMNRNRQRMRVSSCHPYLLSLLFPLFFPRGSRNWHPGMPLKAVRGRRPRTAHKNITRRMYYSYLLHYKHCQTNNIHRGRRLFQYFVLNGWLNVEGDRLWYLRSHQEEIYAGTRRGLRDYLHSRAEANNADINYGRMILLPQTFEQSPACMHKRYLDSMALVKKYGIPDLFITGTTNPQWKEIQENLMPNQKYFDRPDLIARVFYLRFNKIKNLIESGEVFGPVAAVECSFEFQKRGLPHFHMIIWLRHGFKMRSAEVIDRHVWATIPDAAEDQVLHDLVVKHMLHNLCGQEYHGARCMQNGRCSKNFPKRFRDETVLQDEGGRVGYKRPNNGATFADKQNRIYTNRHVVSYNPVLLKYFEAHVNVDVVNSHSSLSYIFKYLFKGSDAMNIEAGAVQVEGQEQVPENIAGAEAHPVALNVNFDADIPVTAPENASPAANRRRRRIVRDHSPPQRPPETQEGATAAAAFRNLSIEADRADARGELQNASPPQETPRTTERVEPQEQRPPEPVAGPSRELVPRPAEHVDPLDGDIENLAPNFVVDEHGNVHRYVPVRAQIYIDYIKTYWKMKYTAAIEAVWRILCFPFHYSDHVVIQLALHDVEEEMFYFTRGQEVLRQEEVGRSTFIAVMKLYADPVLGAEARQYKYEDIPQYYRYNKGPCTWTKKVRRGRVLGRIIRISVVNMPIYYIYLLVINTTGYGSYVQLRTVRGVIYDTYKEACEALGLLRNNDEHAQVIFHAIQFGSGRQARRLFAHMLPHCGILNPLELFNQVEVRLCADYAARRNTDAASARARAIRQIAYYLRRMDFVPDDWPEMIQAINLPPVAPLQAEIVDEDEEELAQRHVDAEGLAQTLNTEQRAFFDLIVLLVTRIMRPDTTLAEHNLYYLAGEAGTGKTYLYKAIHQYLTGIGKKLKCVSWTGISAQLLPGGSTCHYTFGLPLNIHQTSTCFVPLESIKAKVLRECHVIIWDEVSMAHKEALRMINKLLQEIMGNELAFGGKLLIVSGDFRQLLPVVNYVPSSLASVYSPTYSALWPLFERHDLVINQRAAIDLPFSAWLGKIGRGSHDTVAGCGTQTIRVPDRLLVSRDELITAVFGDDILANGDNRAILTPTNAEALVVNDEIVNLLPGEPRELLSADTVKDLPDDDVPDVPLAIIHKLTPSGLPPHRLLVKQGCVVMLIRNIDVSSGLANGTRLKVLDCTSPFILKLQILCGDRKGDVVHVPRMSFRCETTETPAPFERLQFPLRPAYAITVNKSQGQTLDRVGVHLPRPCFSHGQLYVALSRVATYNHVVVCLPNPYGNVRGNFRVTNAQVLHATMHTHNIVSQDVLMKAARLQAADIPAIRATVRDYQNQQ